MSQRDATRTKFLYIVILLLLVVIGFMGYQLYSHGNTLESLVYGKRDSGKHTSDKEAVEYAQPTTRKSNYSLHSHGRQQYWDPYTEMERMQEHINQVLKLTMNRFQEHDIEDDFQRFNFNLNAEVSEDSRYYVLNIAVPNVKPDSIEVNVTEKQLQLKGVNEESMEEKDSKGNIVQSEMKSTSFFRSINFPEKVDPSSLEKKVENGVLQIKLKKLSAKN